MDIKKKILEIRNITKLGIVDCKKALLESGCEVKKAIEYLRIKGKLKAAKLSSRTSKEGKLIVKEKGNKAIILGLNSETDFVAKNNYFSELLEKISTAIINSSITKFDLDKVHNIKLSPTSTIKDLLEEATAKIGENIKISEVKIVEKRHNQKFYTYTHFDFLSASILVIDLQKAKMSNDLEDFLSTITMQIVSTFPKFVDIAEISKDFIENEKSIITKEIKEKMKDKPNLVEKIVENKINKVLSDYTLVNQPYIKLPKQKVKVLLDKYKVKCIKLSYLTI